jgi:hypothetical protein
MSFDSTIAADALEHLKALGATLHTYTPRGASGVSRYILVDRNGLNRQTGTIGGFSASVEIFICNDATNGVTAVSCGGDTITVTPRYGEAAKTYRIDEIVDNDAGIWHLRSNVNG